MVVSPKSPDRSARGGDFYLPKPRTSNGPLKVLLVLRSAELILERPLPPIAAPIAVNDPRVDLLREKNREDTNLPQYAYVNSLSGIDVGVFTEASSCPPAIASRQRNDCRYGWLQLNA